MNAVISQRRRRTRRRAGAATRAPCRPGVAFTSWIEPDLTTVSSRWVCPPGPAATGGAAVATAVAVATAGAVAGGAASAARRVGLASAAPWPPSSARAGGPGCGWPPGAAASPGAGPLGRRGRGSAGVRRRLCGGLAPSRGPPRLACAGVRGSRSSDHPRPVISSQSGPLMPPSLRTRQKWMAMKMTITNGSISTCSTYQRSNVSVPISVPPRSTKRTWVPKTGV